MSLSKEQIKENKEIFINLVSEIKRSDSDIDILIKDLEASDFFDAPASTRYHSAYKGGLCQHSLNVLNNLFMLVDDLGYKDIISRESIIIVALFHDFSKANFYELYLRNVKDEFGNWKQVAEYKVRDAEKRFLCHSHAVNSFYMLSKYISLTDEEACAIMNHHAVWDDSVDKNELSMLYNKYSLAALLHTADMLATYINEKI